MTDLAVAGVGPCDVEVGGGVACSGAECVLLASRGYAVAADVPAAMHTDIHGEMHGEMHGDMQGEMCPALSVGDKASAEAAGTEYALDERALVVLLHEADFDTFAQVYWGQRDLEAMTHVCVDAGGHLYLELLLADGTAFLVCVPQGLGRDVLLRTGTLVLIPAVATVQHLLGGVTHPFAAREGIVLRLDVTPLGGWQR